MPLISLSKNFTLSEMIDSSTAKRMNITEQFTPDDIVIKNLTVLCTKVLQPIRDSIDEGYIKVSSGYRCLRLNTHIMSKPSSFHVKGCAADISWIINGEKHNKELYDLILSKIKSKVIPFTELIDEFNLSWVHIAYDPKSILKRISKIE